MKKLNQFILLFTTICSLNSSAQTIPSYVPTNGLKGWWPFSGNANDYTSNANNGSVNGATITTDRFGNNNAAYVFDGLNDLISFIQQPIQNVDSFSLSFWLKPNSLNQFSTAVCLGYDAGASSGNIGIQFGMTGLPANPFTCTNINGNKLSFIRSGLGCGSVNYNFVDTTSWHKVAITRKSGFIKYYVDGNFITSNSLSIINAIPQFRVGSSFGFRFFNGKIDDIGIWNRALTDCEIKKLYNSGSGLTLSTSSSTICLGESKILSASGATNYLWSTGATTSSITVTPTVNTIYTVTTTYSVGCTDMRTITITVNPCTSVNEYDDSQLLSIFPNPAKTQININTDINYTSLIIVNSIGQVMIKNEKTNVLSIESLNHGFYFIQLLDKENKVLAIKKFIKE